MRLLLLFLILPVLEIAVFIQVGDLIGLWPTVGLVILSILLGVTLLRRQGIAAAARVQRSVRETGDPTAPLAQGALAMIAGILLIIPGFLTDIAALMLLIPPVQRLILRRMGQSARVRVFGRMPFGQRPGQHRSSNPDGGRIIEADYVVVEEGDSEPPQGGPPRRPSGWTQP